MSMAGIEVLPCCAGMNGRVLMRERREMRWRREVGLKLLLLEGKEGLEGREAKDDTRGRHEEHNGDRGASPLLARMEKRKGRSVWYEIGRQK